MSKLTDKFKLTAFQVANNEQAEEVQKAMFALGFKWNSGNRSLNRYWASGGWLYVNRNCRIVSSGISFYDSGADAYVPTDKAVLFAAVVEHKAERKAAKKASKKRKALRKQGWTIHTSGECPVLEDTIVTTLFSDGSGSKDKAGAWSWNKSWMAPIAYKLAEEKKPEAVSVHTMVADIVQSAKGVEVDSDGFIVWNGGECPVPAGTLVDVKYRRGVGASGVKALTRNGSEMVRDASARFWSNDNHQSDIVAYRLTNAPKVENPETVTLEEMLIEVQTPNVPFSGYRTGERIVPATPLAAVGDIDSDSRGSGARFNSGKPDFSLIPLSTLEGEARVWAYGAKKYKEWNWLKGMDWSVPYACALRHLAAWQRGEEVDPETGENHLDHAMCNLRMLRYYADYYKEGDNRPTQFFVKGE